jgi:hypothetical protein
MRIIPMRLVRANKLTPGDTSKSSEMSDIVGASEKREAVSYAK